MKRFETINLLLPNKSAQRLYHDYAAQMPIYDYHNHLNPRDIASNRSFRNLTNIWLEGDHYKWRAMRWLGIDESLITGEASDKDKFMAWARSVPRMVGNPLYHWTHLELERYFGFKEVLSAANAEEVWNQCNEMLQQPSLRAGSILDQWDVRVACTTDDPIDDLRSHQDIRENIELRAVVVPTFRPDRALDISHPNFKEYVKDLGIAAEISINSYSVLLQALEQRIQYFHAHGCRLSDHGFGEFPFIYATESETAAIYTKVIQGESITAEEEQKYRTYTLLQLGAMYQAQGWAMQLHMGASRNNNARMMSKLGKDSGYDSILDFHLASRLNNFLSELDQNGQLPKTIVYSLYPAHYTMLATTIGNFQNAEAEGKLQLGSAWWFHDQKEGMLEQMKALSSIGLISTFIGMLTDSRSFMSFPRHEYFRRILCGLFGQWIEDGELPADYDYIGKIIQDICYNNATRYFGIQ